jgi:hypothetical protein
MENTIDILNRNLTASLKAIEDEAHLLLGWITLSRTGGWSTHLCEPMEKRRAELLDLWARIRREVPQ